jgi:ABC transport system ATP-binding/permease protein
MWWIVLKVTAAIWIGKLLDMNRIKRNVGMALISLQDVTWGFAEPPLLENISLQIEKGERICMVGRNGVGKSTLLKILAGEILPDKGTIAKQQGLTIAALKQEVPAGFNGTIFEVIAESLGEKGRALSEYHKISRDSSGDRIAEAAHSKLQQRLDALDGWGLLHQIETVLSRLQLDPNLSFTGLSAGLKRRVLFARSLSEKPDILLLDEPTNHLDIDTILWMEAFILQHVKTLLFVSHDREFMKKIAGRIIELDRGRLTSYACDYKAYVKRSDAAIEEENRQNGVFDKKLAKEETWIRQGLKARRGRNQGRVRALKRMREAYRSRRQKIGEAKIVLQEAERTGKLVIEAKRLGYAYRENRVLTDFSTIIMRGDKLGIIGPNGVGKTTLLKILFKELDPDEGSVRHGTNLQVAYLDQLREQLDEKKTVRDNIGEGNDFVVCNGTKRHVISYLKDFLFSSERCGTPVHVLSGGEKNRLLMAKLFTRPANVLVLDEPTNDLDAETLLLLEDLLFEFSGTVLLVSHDRAFLNNVVTSSIVFEGDSRVVEYAGGYDDWLLQRKTPEALSSKNKIREKRQKSEARQIKKLGYMEKRELESLPQKIEALEAEQKRLFQTMSDPLFYQKDKEEIAAIKAKLDEVEQTCGSAYLRWEILEQIDNNGRE